MPNNCRIQVRVAIAAIAGSMLFGFPAHAGNMTHSLNSQPGAGTLGEADENASSRTGAGTAGADGNLSTILDPSDSASYQFYSPGLEDIATNSGGAEPFDIRDVAQFSRMGGSVDLDPVEMLGPAFGGTMAFSNVGYSQIVIDQDSVPSLSRARENRPAVIKWIYSLLEAVGISERCDDPEGCGSRVAVND